MPVFIPPSKGGGGGVLLPGGGPVFIPTTGGAKGKKKQKKRGFFDSLVHDVTHPGLSEAFALTNPLSLPFYIAGHAKHGPARTIGHVGQALLQSPQMMVAHPKGTAKDLGKLAVSPVEMAAGLTAPYVHAFQGLLPPTMGGKTRGTEHGPRRGQHPRPGRGEGSDLRLAGRAAEASDQAERDRPAQGDRRGLQAALRRGLEAATPARIRSGTSPIC